eukprot:750636-Hanusia_phi.AAC.6
MIVPRNISCSCILNCSRLFFCLLALSPPEVATSQPLRHHPVGFHAYSWVRPLVLERERIDEGRRLLGLLEHFHIPLRTLLPAEVLFHAANLQGKSLKTARGFQHGQSYHHLTPAVLEVAVGVQSVPQAELMQARGREWEQQRVGSGGSKVQEKRKREGERSRETGETRVTQGVNKKTAEEATLTCSPAESALSNFHPVPYLEPLSSELLLPSPNLSSPGVRILERIVLDHRILQAVRQPGSQWHERLGRCRSAAHTSARALAPGTPGLGHRETEEKQARKRRRDEGTRRED